MSTLRGYAPNGVPQKVNGKYTLIDGEARAAIPASEVTPGANHSGWADGTIDVSQHNVFIIAPTIPPAYNQLTHHAPIEDAFVQIAGVWTQQWADPVALTQAEIDAVYQATVPQQVTMRQARRALLNAGLLTTVNTAIAAMTGVEGDAARIDWEFSSTVERNQPLVISMGAALGLSSAQLDALFIAASQITTAG